jgi:hypothetical protein
VAEGRQRNRGFFSDLLRGVSDPREGSEILFFLFRTPTGMQLAPTSSKLVDGKFSEVRQKSFKDHQSGEQNVGIPMP